MIFADTNILLRSLQAANLVNPELLEYMREWRREISRSENIPAFMVLHDSGLEDLCRKQPRTPAALLHVLGIGEKKGQLYGQRILDALDQFRQGARVTEREESKEPRFRRTRAAQVEKV